jgi:hypothetical protein
MATRPTATIKAWDQPVVDALDRIERLEGFQPGQVEWDGFRYWGSRLPWTSYQQIVRAGISAYPGAEARPYVRFTAQVEEELTIYGPDGQNLQPEDVADILHAPTESAAQAVSEIGSALHQSLNLYRSMFPGADSDP